MKLTFILLKKKYIYKHLQEKNMKKLQKNWKEYNYKVESNLVNSNLISNCVKQFWKKIISKFSKNISIAIQLKIQHSELKEFRSITNVQVISNKDELLQDVIDLFVSSWKDCNEYYHLLIIDNIIISYKELNLVGQQTKFNSFSEQKKIDETTTLTRLRSKKDLLKKNRFTFKGKTMLPSTLNLTKWGSIMKETKKLAIISPNQDSSVRQSSIDDKTLFYVQKYLNKYEVQIKIGQFCKFKFTDYFEDNINNPLNLSAAEK